METKKRKGIRFQEDPEWQPDERVVLFQHFFEGIFIPVQIQRFH